jgi:hypothetical protein
MWLAVGLEDFTGDESLVGRLRTFLDVFAAHFPTAAGHLRKMLDHVLVRQRFKGFIFGHLDLNGGKNPGILKMLDTCWCVSDLKDSFLGIWT